MNVSDVIATLLASEGTRAVFSTLGDTNMGFVCALSEHGVPVYECRHEATAMAMADGFARATRELAVCSTTAGPGFAHTFVPLLSAARHGNAPVILVTGQHTRDDVGGRQFLDHRGLARLAEVGYRTIADTMSVVSGVRSAVDAAFRQQRPVVLDIPLDVQELQYNGPIPIRGRSYWRTPQRVHPDPDAVADGKALLGESQKVVVLAGSGARSPECMMELVRLAEETNGLLATTTDARGLFDEVPFNAGIAGAYSTPIATELFQDADCVVSFGASLNTYTTQAGSLFPKAKYIQVDERVPGPMQNGESAACYIRGDAAVVARALRLGGLGLRRGIGFRSENILEALSHEAVDPAEFQIAPGEVDPRIVCSRVDELLPADVGVVSGSAHYWEFVQMHMKRHRRLMLHASYFGSTGYSVSVAAGAALGVSGSVVAFEGDAGFMMYPGALDTVVRSGADMLIIIMNDRALGSEFHKLRARGAASELAVWPDRDFADLAMALGARAFHVRDIGSLDHVIADFLANSGTVVADISIARNVVARPYRRKYFGTDAVG